MTTLQEKLHTIVSATWDSPIAVIVDDELNADDGRSLADWQTFTTILQRDTAFYNSFDDFLNERNHNIESPPNLELWKELSQSLIFPDDSEIRDAVRKYEEREQIVSRLTSFLQDIGFTIRSFDSKPNISDIRSAHLFLVDYQLVPESDDGESAKRLFSELMAACKESTTPPPLVILMSKKSEPTDAVSWEDVGSSAGFYRCNFDFINKSAFENEPAILSLALMGMLQHKPVADAYFKQLCACSAAAYKEVETVLSNLFQVTPSEALIFKDKIKNEGVGLAEICCNLFTTHLSRRLERSSEVRAEMETFAEAVSSEGIMAPRSTCRNTLFRLHAELLFEPCQESDNSPPAFGDVYSLVSDEYLLLLSQACDLQLRADGRPTKEQILTIKGVLKNRDRQKGESESIRSRPVLMEGDQLKWLHFDIAHPFIVTFDQLRNKAFIKKFRMLSDHAQDIRHAFIYQLTRVGLDILPEFVFHSRCVLYSERHHQLLPGDIGLYQIGIGQSASFAISPDCKALYVGHGKHPFVSPDKITELGRFRKRFEFHTALMELRIVMRSNENTGSIVFCKTRDGSLSSETSKWLSENEYT